MLIIPNVLSKKLAKADVKYSWAFMDIRVNKKLR